MHALKYVTTVNTGGNVVLPPLGLQEGTAIEVIVLVAEEDTETTDFQLASESSTAFWNNPIDDKVWNDA